MKKLLALIIVCSSSYAYGLSGAPPVLAQTEGGTGATSLATGVGSLLPCTPGSPIAPVNAGQAFICQGVVMIAQ